MQDALADKIVKMSYSTLIKNFREAREMTHQQFGDAVGVSRAAVQQWERGVTAPTRKNQPVVAAFMGISVAELMAETTTYLLAPGAKQSNQTLSLTGRARSALELIELDNNPDYPAIRRVNITAKAGVTGYAVDYIDEDRPPIFFRRDWYDSNGYKPEKLIAIRVAGESMVPSLHPGDLIVVNTAQTQPKQGIAFLVSFEGEVVVKRLVRDDSQWWLTSDNQDQRRYPRVKCNGETEIIGEVVYRQTEVI